MSACDLVTCRTMAIVIKRGNPKPPKCVLEVGTKSSKLVMSFNVFHKCLNGTMNFTDPKKENTLLRPMLCNITYKHFSYL